jgi:hypothetical protein
MEEVFQINKLFIMEIIHRRLGNHSPFGIDGGLHYNEQRKKGSIKDGA